MAFTGPDTVAFWSSFSFSSSMPGNKYYGSVSAGFFVINYLTSGYLWCADGGTFGGSQGGITINPVTVPSGGWYSISGTTAMPLQGAPDIQTTDLFAIYGAPPPIELIDTGFFSSTPPVSIPGISAGLYFLEGNDVLTPLDDSAAISDLETRMAAVEAWMAQAEAAAGTANGGV